MNVTEIWATDGNDIRTKEIDDLLFQDSIIRDFLNSPSAYFVSGSKGMGKTLILKEKRRRLTSYYKQLDNREVLAIPSDETFLDFLGILPPLSEGVLNYLSQIDNCRQLWKLALDLSILSHFEWALSDPDKERVSRIPHFLQRCFTQCPKLTPCNVMSHLLTEYSPSQLIQYVANLRGICVELERAIKATVIVFIDKTDQATGHLSQHAWINFQAGLIEAALDIRQYIAAVGIYGSIRQEAFATYTSGIKSNVTGSVTRLDYIGHEDVDILASPIKALIDRLVLHYEGIETLEKWLQNDTIENTFGFSPERTFSYIYRHTTGRPRDLVVLCKNLHDQKRPLSFSAIKTLVNDVSDQNVNDVFEENRPFLEHLRDPAERKRFFSLFPHSILSAEQLKSIYAQFMHVDEISFNEGNPFDELYCCGLFGNIVHENVNNVTRIMFKQPNSSTLTLPQSKLYVIHPTLISTIEKAASEGNFYIYRGIIYGHRAIWGEKEQNVFSFQRAVLDWECYLGNTEANRVRELMCQLLEDIKLSIRQKASFVTRSSGEQLYSLMEFKAFLERELLLKRDHVNNDYVIRVGERLESLLDKFLGIKGKAS